MQYFMKAAQILENELQDAEVEGEEVRSVVEARWAFSVGGVGHETLLQTNIGNVCYW